MWCLESKGSCRLVLGFPSTTPGHSEVQGSWDSPSPIYSPALTWLSGPWIDLFFFSSLSVMWRTPETEVEGTSLLALFYQIKQGRKQPFGHAQIPFSRDNEQ